MALIKCPNCGTLVSNKAYACPVCGVPVSKIIAELNEEDTVQAPAQPPVQAPVQPSVQAPAPAPAPAPVAPVAPAPAPVAPVAPPMPAGDSARSSKEGKMLIPLLVAIAILLLGLLVVGVAVIVRKSPEGQAQTSTMAAPSSSFYEQPQQPQQSQPSQTQRSYSQSSGVPGMFPEGSTRYLSEYDLVDKTPWQLMIMRNEIYARHHYIFKLAELRDHFNSQSWYTGYESDAKVVARSFSDIERSNVSVIKNYEKLFK